jgi:hypothetical protein
MADDPKPAKKRKAADDGVLASLPSTRPSRLSRRGRKDGAAPAATKAKATTTKAKAKAKPSAPKPKAAAKPQLKAVSAAGDPKPRKPRAVRAATATLTEPAATANENREPAEERADAKGQSGKELATTVVQAAGELAQIGLAVGGQIIKRAVDRLPKP